MLNTFANVLCEIVFACMLYHTEYYRIIVIAYDYECSQHHASFHVYVRLGSEPGTPLPTPPHTLLNEPMKKTYESQCDKKKKKKKKKNGEIKKQVKS